MSLLALAKSFWGVPPLGGVSPGGAWEVVHPPGGGERYPQLGSVTPNWEVLLSNISDMR